MYMQAFYGVTAQQSARSGYALYTPGAGWRDVRGNASLTYFFTPEWSMTGALTVRALEGDVKRSPIVNEDTPVAGLLALNYSF
jgi:outer membrane scaffolding protein for murein synthesis (MipA/OmpV family)